MTLATDVSYKSVIFGVSLKDLTISRVCSVNLAGVYVVVYCTKTFKNSTNDIDKGKRN